jgi:hypothetical protein
MTTLAGVHTIASRSIYAAEFAQALVALPAPGDPA